jgi:hypothetical protein
MSSVWDDVIGQTRAIDQLTAATIATPAMRGLPSLANTRMYEKFAGQARLSRPNKPARLCVSLRLLPLKAHAKY